METITITVSTTLPIKDHLDNLVETGLYGKNAAEAAERLIARSLKALISDGTLPNEVREGKKRSRK